MCRRGSDWPVKVFDLGRTLLNPNRSQIMAVIARCLQHGTKIGFIMLLAMGSLAVTNAEDLPIVYRCDFEEGAADWAPTDQTAWKIDHTLAENAVYSQFKKRSAYNPPHRSPYNIALVKKLDLGTFQLDVKVLSTHKDYNHRDACLFFGYQNPGQFYYVHLGKKADPHANQIFIVNKSPRIKISSKTTSGTNWDSKWHHVRITRNVITGKIAVFFDDMNKPAMQATDRSFLSGQIGLGSFDDTTAWNDLIVRGSLTKRSSVK